MDRGRELLGLRHVGRRGFAPDQVGVGGVGEAACDCCVDTVPHPEEALGRSLAGAELAVDLVDIACQQRRRQRVGARDDEGRHVGDIGGEPRRDERPDVLRGRHEHLAAEMTALLLGGELVLEVHGGRACLDERLHHLVGVERAAEAGLGVGDDRGEPVGRIVALGVGDLVGAQQGAVDPLDESWSAVRGIEALVGVRVTGEVRVGRDLPAREVDRLQAGLHHLHRLATGHRSECRHPLLLGEEPPQPLRAEAGERVLDRDGAAEALDVLLAVGALDRSGPCHTTLLWDPKYVFLDPT